MKQIFLGAALLGCATSGAFGCGSSDGTPSTAASFAGANAASGGSSGSRPASATGGAAGSSLATGGGMAGVSSGGAGGGASGAGGTLGTGGSAASNAGAAGSSGAPVTNSGGASGGFAGAIAPPARILCVGDSITERADSWIYPVQDALKSSSCRYKLIGYDEGPYNGPYTVKPGYDNQRIAAGGFNTTGILNLIKEKGLAGVPDVVVEYLGVNNEYGGFIDGKYNPDDSKDPVGTYVKDNHDLMQLVRAVNPNVIWFLMKIENNALPDIDSAIDQVVSAESTPNSPVIAVKDATGVETIDGIHPTAAGAATLAGPIATALTAMLTTQSLCH